MSMHLSIEWTEFKAQFTAKQMTYMGITTGGYQVWVLSPNITVTTFIRKQSDITDFETNFKSGATDIKNVTSGMTTGRQPVISAMKTYHYHDKAISSQTVNADTDTLYKTYTNVAGSFLKEILIDLDDRDAEISIWIDDEELSRWDVDALYTIYGTGNGNALSVGCTNISVWKNSGNYTSRVQYENTPITTNLKIKIKRNKNGSETQDINNVIIIFDKEV